MANEAPPPSNDWRALLFLNLHRAGKLNDEFLPPEEFMIVRNKPFGDWPENLKSKLLPFGAGAVERADLHS